MRNLGKKGNLIAFDGSLFPEVTRYRASLWLKPVSD